ncbi:hypothetical protein [Nostoc sp. TCL26-01]|uniref:hypothetical protein n=1 Tax=Nostoc sp. TCL26-01 TaxID=2576904 RepID=UPI00211925C6|nr:hypothetical protein [Nostoc sp. TCL26-01]
MTLPLNQSVLLESKTLRTSAITNFSDDRALEILAKAKAIIFAVWGGAGWATTAQIAEYFVVTESSVRELFRVNGAEFRDLETKTLTGKDLRDARQTLCLPSKTSQARVFSALGALRIAMLLTPSEERWLGVVNFAESELGRNVPTSGSHYRGHLGTWVRTFYPQLGERQETRIVQGTQQKIYVYACHDPVVAAGLTKAVEEFFAHPEPAAKLRQAGAFKKAVVTA